jgi:hypothetical protein
MKLLEFLENKYKDFSELLSLRMSKSLSHHIREMTEELTSLPIPESDRHEILDAVKAQDFLKLQKLIMHYAEPAINKHHIYMRLLRIPSLFLSHSDYLDYCSANVTTNVHIADSLMRSTTPPKGEVQYQDPRYSYINANVYHEE